MADLDYSFTESELVSEVRDALAGLDAKKVPDDTIAQTADRFVVPLLNSMGSYTNDDQTDFDNAVIAWSAEKSFDAWLTLTRLRDREVEAYVNPSQYRKNIETRTNDALYTLGVTRPPDVPNTIYSVQSSGEGEEIVLQRTLLKSYK